MAPAMELARAPSPSFPEEVEERAEANRIVGDGGGPAGREPSPPRLAPRLLRTLMGASWIGSRLSAASASRRPYSMSVPALASAVISVSADDESTTSVSFVSLSPAAAPAAAPADACATSPPVTVRQAEWLAGAEMQAKNDSGREELGI